MDTRIAVCKKHGAIPFHPGTEQVLMVAMDTLSHLPLNGVRIYPESGCCGWYVWGGPETAVDSGEFSRMHISYVPKYLPEIDRFLALPPGFRFLKAGAHTDVTYDQGVLGHLKFA